MDFDGTSAAGNRLRSGEHDPPARGDKQFRAQTKENIVTGSGEFPLMRAGLALRKPFALNATASIRDLAALAGLLGPPFDEMTGRMSLSGSINGQAGKLSGFISLEASGRFVSARYWLQPSGRDFLQH